MAFLLLDYRLLNRYTKTKGWPIPNILDVLANIGEHRPNFFAVMDCTSGFHQMPLSEACQKFTTFTTKYGNWKFTRAPMGPTNIPGQYQKAMVTEVFPDMVTRIMEIYLDDLLTWAKDIPELIERLGLIFARLRQFNITLTYVDTVSPRSFLLTSAMAAKKRLQHQRCMR